MIDLIVYIKGPSEVSKMIQRWNKEYMKGYAKHILSTLTGGAQESCIMEDNEGKTQAP